MDERLQAIVELINEGVVYQEANGEIKIWNRGAQRIFGLSAQEAQGLTSTNHDWHLIFQDGSDCPGHLHPSMITLRTGQALRDQIRGVLRADGGVTWLSISTTPVIDPGQTKPHAVIISFSDITERIQAQEAMMRSEERFQQITRHSRELVWEVDARGLFTYVSQASSSVLGYQPAELVGRVHLFDLHPERGRDDFRAQILDAFARRQQFRDSLKPAVTKDGRTVWLSTNGAPILDAQGELTGYVGSDNDVSERLWAERSLRLLAESGRGEDIFRFLVRHLAHSLGAKHAFIARIDPDDPDLCHTLAVYSGRDFAPNFSYRLPGTPCSNVQERSACFFARDVARMFPEDTTLTEWGVETYWGTPLRDSRGRVLGIAAVMDGLELRETPQSRSLLESFAVRASVELERRQAEKKYQTLFRKMLDGFALHEMVFDEEGQAVDYRFLDVNPAFQRLTGLKAEDILGKTVLEVMPGTELSWIATYARVVRTGEPVTLQSYAQELKKHFEVTAFRPAPGQFACIFTDITEHTQALEALRQSESNFRLLASLTNEGIVMHHQGCIVFANDQFYRICGFTPEEMRGQDALQLTMTNASREAARRRILTGDMRPYEVMGQRKDGTTLPIQVRPSTAEFNGQMVRVGVIRDLTEEKRAAEALRDNEERFRVTFEQAAVGMSLLTPDGAWLKVNQRLCEILGYTRDELLSMTFKDLTHPDDLNQDMSRMQAMLQGKHSGETWVKRYVRKDGQTIWVRITTALTLTADGQPHHFITVTEDITERQRTEEALRESERLFRLTFHTSPDSININRVSDGLYVDINEGFTRLTGYDRDDVIGRSSLELGIWADPRDREKLVDGLRDKGYCENLEAQFRRKDGSLTTALMSARVILIQGEPHIISITRDISALKTAQEESRRLEDQLRQAQKMEALGTLAGGIAHDFNNILAAITGYTELALDNEPLGRSSRRELEQVLKATERAKELVKNILAFSRKTEVEFRPLDLNHEVRQAAAILERAIPRMVRLELRLRGDITLVRGDAAQLQQVILNLGANATDSMPDGGRLTIQTDLVELAPGSPPPHPEMPPGRYAILEVGDTGHGISSQVMQHIFDPFFTTKEVGKGTGLGLAMVYGTVKSHHGHVLCFSQPGQGTTFRIYLPAEEPADVSRPDGAPAPVEETGNGELILLVDDEPAMRDIGQQTLGARGYQVLAAASGEEALELYARLGDAIAVVILDVGMPGMGGRRCLEKLLELNPRVKVVIASGYAKDVAITQAIASGAVGYVAKPFTRAALLASVGQALRG